MSLKRTSILVYKSGHGLVRLYCPFEVITKEGKSALVDFVLFAPNLPFFSVNGVALPCYWFRIILK